MIGPSSQISKTLLLLLVLLVVWYAFMDAWLYLRVQNYPFERGLSDNGTPSYADVRWVSCDINPLCDLTPKAVMLDHTNIYLFAPFVKIFDNVLKVSDVEWITPNSISVFHVLVAILSAKCVSSDSLAYRRVGVVMFQVRTFLDDLDGHVARKRKHIKGEMSEIGTSGYYIDGLCDGLGIIALMVGTFIFLKNNPPRRGYVPLPTIVNEADREAGVTYKAKVTTKKVVRTICFFSAQLLLSSAAWNRYIALYQDLLASSNAGLTEGQNVVLKSSFFFAITWLWRVINIHNLLHVMMLAIFCDKLWDFLRAVQYAGFVVLLSAICVSEVHISEVRNVVYRRFTNGTTY